MRDGEYLPQPYAFSHDRERASCGYYAVELPGEGVVAELTAAPRTGVHRYTFRGSGPRRVVIDLMHTITDEKIDMRELRQTAPDEIAGMPAHAGDGSPITTFSSRPAFRNLSPTCSCSETGRPC